MEYNFSEIEKKWQAYWSLHKTYKAEQASFKPKYYILDMFPYPSGAGLHVGHPLGYIASDIYSRFKRLTGFNVLHPMGYDAFGLPAEQYAIQTGQHPAITTEKNIERYREQLDKIGFSFDWDRQVKTSEPNYYKWTQWIFIQLFKSWYNKKTDKAETIEALVEEFQENGNTKIKAASDYEGVFSGDEWKSMDEKKQQEILLNYRLTYLSDTMVNWCPDLGTVLANEEVRDGLSERGGYPVERKLMKQWSMRITAYADRLLKDLQDIDWSESIKEQQRNWIGKSTGASVNFQIDGHKEKIEVFTTRPDTIFGVTFLTLAPEHELIDKITTSSQKNEVEKYVQVAKNRTERERMTEVKKITGQFTGAYAIHPFTNEKLPVWTGDYVLGGYGTGAVMSVPGHDLRDYAFAEHFNIPIKEVVKGGNVLEQAYEPKEGIMVNSDFLEGMQVKQAIEKAIEKIEEKSIGKGKTNFRIRDAIFSRQRYWGEPFPVYYKDGLPYMLNEDELPLELPEVDKYLPTESGEPPLARAKNWKTKKGYPYETSTMPGWAGSSWYFLRYMDSGNKEEFVSKEANEYWQNVDLYIGGSEHATGHLLYSRFWNKFLFDLGYIVDKEPFKKLINQGMIQGVSCIVYRYDIGYKEGNQFKYKATNFYLSKKIAETIIDGEVVDNDLKQIIIEQEGEEFWKNNEKQLGFLIAADINKEDITTGAKIKKTPLYVDIKYCDGERVNIELLAQEDMRFLNANFIKENDGSFLSCREVEKMSKSKFNVVNPDDIVERYGADTLRLYEMFLGPLEQSKPWSTNGIEGVHRFLKKLWRLFINDKGQVDISDEHPDQTELKALHKTIKKVKEDIERFSFNTSVSNFMICVNELSDLKCNKREILKDLTILLSPYAPHIAEEFWSLLGNTRSVTFAHFPEFNQAYLIEDNFNYPVCFNGKTRFMLELPTNLAKEQIQKEVLASAETQKWLAGNKPKNVIVVPNKIVNVVI
ncbi:MAG: leucine--tRNA ligase [Bacteroidetes bacterium]|nr:leucine--tRNA ligase [Bacteroidota bacterium]HET6245724.1 leucine--tRNA ligase [Bacteroidia bacterium]